MSGTTTAHQQLDQGLCGPNLRSKLPANLGLSRNSLAQVLWIQRQSFNRHFEAYATTMLETYSVVQNLVEVVPEIFDSDEVLPAFEKSLGLDSQTCLEYMQKAFLEFIRASQEQVIGSLLDRQKATYQSPKVIQTISQYVSHKFQDLEELHKERMNTLGTLESLQSKVKASVDELPSTRMQPEALEPLVDLEDEDFEEEFIAPDPVAQAPAVQDEDEEEGMVMVAPKAVVVPPPKVQQVTRHFRVDGTSLPAILEQKSITPAWNLSPIQLEVFLRSELLFKQVKHQLPSGFGLVLIDKASTKRKRTAVIIKLVPPKAGQAAAEARAAGANARGGGRGGFGGFGARPAARAAEAEALVGEDAPAEAAPPQEGGFRFGPAEPAPAFGQPNLGFGAVAAYPAAGGFGNPANRGGFGNGQATTAHLVELDLLTGEVTPIHDLPFLPDYLTHTGTCIGLASKNVKNIKVFKDSSEIYSAAPDQQQPFGAAPSAVTTSMNQFVLHQGAIFFLTPTNEIVKYLVEKDSSFQVIIGTSRVKGICFWNSYLAAIDDTSNVTFYSTKNLTLVKKCAIPSSTKIISKDAKVTSTYYSCLSDNQVLITLSKVNRPGLAAQMSSINLHTVSKSLSASLVSELADVADPNSNTASLTLESFFEFPHENAASHFTNSVFFSIKGVKHLGLMAALSSVLAVFCIEHHKIRHRGTVKVLDDASQPGIPRVSDALVLTQLDESLVISRALKQNLIILRPELFL